VTQAQIRTINKLQDLDDVFVSGAIPNGAGPFWNTATGRFEMNTVTIPPGGATRLQDMTDVYHSGPIQSGAAPFWNVANQRFELNPIVFPATPRLQDLPDVYHSGAIVDGTAPFWNNANQRFELVAPPVQTPSGIFTAATAASVPLISRGAAGQTASLQEWQTNVAAVLAYMDKNGALVSANRGNAQYFGGDMDGGSAVAADKLKIIAAVTAFNGSNGARGDSITSDAANQGTAGTSFYAISHSNNNFATKGSWQTEYHLVQAYEVQWTRLSAQVTLPAATIPVSSTTANPAGTAVTWATSGTLNIGGQLVTYTGKTPTAFTGCAGGTGTWAAGTDVTTDGEVAYAEIMPWVSQTTGWRKGALLEAAEMGVTVQANKQARANVVLMAMNENNPYSSYATALGASSGWARTGSRGLWVLSNGAQPGGTGLYFAGGWRYSMLIDMPDPNLWAIVIGQSTDQVGKERFALRGDGVIEMGPGGAAARDVVALQRVTTNTIQLPVIQIGNGWASNADAAVNGYVSVNVQGTVRKLATIA
jgi:hypothetical protein